ncbi:uncharacterized protein LOC123536380 [Mercenaria mercenaria]|uniref:uncharacterized protein LOC123536380 n=1 Tax=Mercenaria mercenaria TaxID=6596 RepID=UPI00234EB73F|nr:uncharacterized protein LOC123536380 [Mercenaria mercenaria]
MSKVTVTLVIPNLAVEKKLFGAAKPKPGESEVDVKFDTTSLEVNAAVTKKGKTTKYHYKVNKLPGEIDPDQCKVEYKKEIVILTMGKTDTTTWAVKMRNGLDQAPSE